MEDSRQPEMKTEKTRISDQINSLDDTTEKKLSLASTKMLSKFVVLFLALLVLFFLASLLFLQ